MARKPGSPLNTGDDFVELAKRRGAKVTQGKSGFVQIETPKGKTYINPSHDVLDKQTISNIKRWFRLLGLMLKFVGFPVGAILSILYLVNKFF